MIEETVKSELLKARKNRNSIATSILSVVLGEIQTAATKQELKDEDKLTIIKKILKSNKTTLKSTEEKNAQFSILTKENEILEEFLPKKLSVENITNIIEEQKLGLGDNPGKAMGVVIRALKAAGHEFDAGDVKKAILAISMVSSEKEAEE